MRHRKAAGDVLTPLGYELIVCLHTAGPRTVDQLADIKHGLNRSRSNVRNSLKELRAHTFVTVQDDTWRVTPRGIAAHTVQRHLNNQAKLSRGVRPHTRKKKAKTR